MLGAPFLMLALGGLALIGGAVRDCAGLATVGLAVMLLGILIATLEG